MDESIPGFQMQILWVGINGQLSYSLLPYTLHSLGCSPQPERADTRPLQPKLAWYRLLHSPAFLRLPAPNPAR